MLSKNGEMDADRVRDYILETFPGVSMIDDEENLFFFYDRDNRVPFVSIVTSNKYDSFSDLDRPDVYRLNFGVRKDTYKRFFQTDKMPLESGHDFTALDAIMPHPEYGKVYWLCVLNPSDGTFETLKSMLAEAYELAVGKYNAAQTARKPGSERS